MHCPDGNATDPIWRVLASSDGISSWPTLKPQHSNRNPNPLANPLWCIDFLPYLSSSLTDSLSSLNLWRYSKTHAPFVQDGRKAVWSILYVSVAFFPSLKHNFIAYRSSSRPDCIFEIHQLWQSGFSKVYSNCCCSSWFEREIRKIRQSSYKMYSNNIVNFQEPTTILNACTKKSGNLLKAPRIYIYIYIYIYYFIHFSFLFRFLVLCMCVCVCVCVCVIGWLVVLFYGVSTLFRSFDAELSFW